MGSEEGKEKEEAEAGERKAGMAKAEVKDRRNDRCLSRIPRRAWTFAERGGVVAQWTFVERGGRCCAIDNVEFCCLHMFCQ